MGKKCDVHAGSEKQEALGVTAHNGWALQCSSERQKGVGVCLRDTVKHLTAWTRNSQILWRKEYKEYDLDENQILACSCM